MNSKVHYFVAYCENVGVLLPQQQRELVELVHQAGQPDAISFVDRQRQRLYKELDLDRGQLWVLIGAVVADGVVVVVVVVVVSVVGGLGKVEEGKQEKSHLGHPRFSQQVLKSSYFEKLSSPGNRLIVKDGWAGTENYI